MKAGLRNVGKYRLKDTPQRDDMDIDNPRSDLPQ
jgi:hypothetical protein